MHDLHRLALHVARVVRVVERLQDLLHDEHGHGRRHPHAFLGGRPQQAQSVEPVDELQRGEVLAVHLPEVQDLHDLRVRQLGGQLRLVDEHGDEARVGGQVRQDSFDDQRLFEPMRRVDLGAEHLRHSADGQLFEQRVAPERHRLGRCQVARHRA
jgi:hypothetical protein